MTTARKKRAVLLALDTRPESSHTRWPLETVDSAAALFHLMARLQKGFPSGELSFTVITSEPWLQSHLEKAVEGLPVEICLSDKRARLDQLAEWTAANRGTKTVLVFPEHALFPDPALSWTMLRRLEDSGADVVYPEGYPRGFLPECFSSQALQRLHALGFPGELAGDPVALMKKANELFPNDKAMTFKVAAFNARVESPAGDLATLPTSVEVDDVFSHAAAASVLAAQGRAHPADANAAFHFKSALLDTEEKGIPPRLRAAADSRLPVAFATCFEGFSGAEEVFFDLMAHIDQTHFQPFVFLPKEGVLSEKIRASGIALEITGMKKNVVTPATLRFFRDRLQATRARILHVNVDVEKSLLLAAHELKIPIVVHIRTLKGAEASDLLKFADRVVAVSDVVRTDLLRSDLRPASVVRIHDGIDLRRFNPADYDRNALRRDFGFATDQKVILMAGRLCPQKRQHLVIDALASVRQALPSVTLLLPGETFPEDHAYRDRLLKQVDDLDLKNHVRFPGFQREPQRFYAVADTLILASDDEAFNHCVLEAMAMGVPVVAPDRGGHVEVVRHDESALLYKAGNPSTLAQAIASVLSDPQRFSALASGGSRVAQSLAIRSHAEKIEALYKEITGRKG